MLIRVVCFISLLLGANSLQAAPHNVARYNQVAALLDSVETERNIMVVAAVEDTVGTYPDLLDLEILVDALTIEKQRQLAAMTEAEAEEAVPGLGLALNPYAERYQLLETLRQNNRKFLWDMIRAVRYAQERSK